MLSNFLKKCKEFHWLWLAVIGLGILWVAVFVAIVATGKANLLFYAAYGAWLATAILMAKEKPYSIVVALGIVGLFLMIWSSTF